MYMVFKQRMPLSPVGVTCCQAAADKIVSVRAHSHAFGHFLCECRKFRWRCNAIAITREDEPRVNSEIRSPQILVIDDKNVKRGIMSVPEALKLAEAADLDLVEVAPQAKPPVCRVMNYGKYRFQQQKRDKDARKKQKNQVVKEIKMRPKIDQHDYDFKVRAIEAFLQAGHRVKVSIFFRGREMAFLDRGRDVLMKVVDAVAQYGKVEVEPRMEGSYMRIMIAPLADTPKKRSHKKPAEPAPEKKPAPKQQAKPQQKTKKFVLDADQI